MNGAGAGALLLAALGLPSAMLLACLWGRLRYRMLALLALAPVPALAAALLTVGGRPLTFEQGLVPVTLALDTPGAMLLGVAALLWIAAGAYTSAYLRRNSASERFAVCWLLTLLGSIGVFIAADLASFFLAYALVSIPAYGLVVHDDTPRARRAGGIYMAFTVLGETLALMGFVLLATAAPGDSLLIRDTVAALPGSPWQDATLALVIAGFGMKIALVPLHFWMPLAYRAAPIPAAAVLSGAAVKAGVIGLIRFLPLGATLPGWGGTLAALGLLTAFYGVAVGITQAHPKTVLAYSSISQMGLIATVLGMGLAAGDAGTGLATAFYAAHHVLVKGALFLAVGMATASGARRLWPVALPAAMLALSLGGLPLTGGALAKLAVKAPLGDGVVSALATLSAAGSTLLMLHFLRRLMSTARNEGMPAPAGLTAPWLAIALASVVVPWLLYPLTDSGSLADALAPAALWAALWPMLIGGVLFVVLRRFGDRLPQVPEGDVLAAGAGMASAAVGWGKAFQQADAWLRQWPVASLSLLAVATLLGAAMLFAH